MMSALTLLPLVGVVLLGAMSPGPDFFVLARRSATSGRGAGVACAVGMGTGIFVWANAVGHGVAALLVASAVAFTVVKLAGAAYLTFLGVRALLSLRQDAQAWEPEISRATQSASRSFREGLLCNLLNPKVAVFYLALFPQFLPPKGGALPTLELSIVAAATVMCWYLVVATVVASVRRFFASKRVRRAVDTAMGTVLIGLGIRVGTS
jgi:threonine/homoserine/homoserine lactone efflux protein